MENPLINFVKTYAGPIALAALAMFILSALGVPLLAILIIIGIGCAYTRGYRANVTITKIKGDRNGNSNT